MRLQLAQEDAEAIAKGAALEMHDAVSPSVLIAQGLDLEEQQDQLRIDVGALGAHPTETQTARITERRNRLARRIGVWQTIQELYMPGAGLLRRSSTPVDGPAEGIDLLLPSAILASSTNSTFAEFEWRLRYGQAHDQLSDLRRQLLVLSTMYQSKDRYVRGQMNNTRSGTLIKNVQARIKFISNRYRKTRSALAVLSGLLTKSGWEATLLPLTDTDLRSLKGGEDASSSEGRRTLSWIWMTQRTSDQEMSATMSEGICYLCPHLSFICPDNMFFIKRYE